MNMNSFPNYTSQSDFTHIISSFDSKEDFDHEKRMVMYRILSEIERVADEKKINRKELARLIGTSASYITQLFRGNKIINIDAIAKFQKALDITFEFKANYNKSEEIINNLNLDQICDNQHTLQGFWAFHTFTRSYNQQEPQIKTPEFNVRRTA